MDNQAAEFQEKIRQQFETAPYPRIPLESSPKYDGNSLFIHNFITPFYFRNQKVTDTAGKVILDAGCGSGYTSLILAESNPGAKIVGIDISEQSVKLAQQRLLFHGFDRAEFYPISLEELPSLGQKIDFINCDEVLYLLPNPIQGLQAMKSVLKEEGIIRANLHSLLQRDLYFRAQKVFKMMGVMEESSAELQVELVQRLMSSLKKECFLKSAIWNEEIASASEYYVISNYLLRGDKGFTVPEMFSALRAADLEFISMVNWREWELTDLFKEPDDLPAFVGLALPEISVEEQLHLFELLHPIHRLLDFWCGHPERANPFVPVAQWTDSDWLCARAHLHPQLRTSQLRSDLLECVATESPFQISRYVPHPSLTPIFIESSVAACLLPLWEGAQPVMSLAERWLKIRPVNPATLEPVSRQAAFEKVKKLLSDLEVFLYVLLERPA